jgi:hypothetical protein
MNLLHTNIVVLFEFQLIFVYQIMIQFLIQIFFVLLISFSTAAQEVIYKDFNVYSANGKIYITCTIQGGNTCNGITLYRSEDSLQFDILEHLPGTCGNTDYDQKYTFTDHNPIKNKRSWYRLYLGGQGYTEALGTEYYDVSSGILIRRIHENTYQLHLNNPLRNNYLFNLYTITGQLLLSRIYNTDQLIIDTDFYGNQALLFELTNTQGSERYTGKLIR